MSFWFDLKVPLTAENQAKAPITQRVSELVDSDPSKNQQYNILVVEDDEVNQVVLLRFLKILGYKATLAENGQEAINRFKTENFDLIIMDSIMPVMDGFDATKKIR